MHVYNNNIYIYILYRNETYLAASTWKGHDKLCGPAAGSCWNAPFGHRFWLKCQCRAVAPSDPSAAGASDVQSESLPRK